MLRGVYPTSEIEYLTRRLRAADGPFFRGLRAALVQHGVDTSQTALVDTFPDGENYDFCVIVTMDCSLPISFGYFYPDGDEGHGVVVDWDDSPDPYSEADDLVERAKRVARTHF
jgi:hypothetical protein